MLVESPGAYLHARRATGSELLSLGAAGAAAALILSSTGDAYVVVALLGLAALEATSVALAGAAFTATLLRWGSRSLAATAGVQAVLGPAVIVAPVLGAVSTAAAAAALLLAATPGPTAVPFGLAAAAIAAGPAGTSPDLLAVRIGASILGAVAALAIARQVPRARRRPLGFAAAAVAVAAALVS